MDGRCTIWVGEGAWRVACVQAGEVSVRVLPHDPQADADPSAQAVAAAELMREMGGAGPVVVALPSHWCLSASLPADQISRANRRQSLAYLLEEHVPLSAEDAVADDVEHQGAVLGVCVELARLTPLMQAFDRAGVTVRHLCPSAMLAGAALAEAHREADALLIRGDAGGDGDNDIDEDGDASPPTGDDLIELAGRLPRRWWWLSGTGALEQQFRVLSGQSDDEAKKLVVFGEPTENEGLETIQSELPSVEHAAALHAARLLAGEVSPWIDFRRDRLAAPDANQLYQKHVAALVAAAVVMLVCLGGAMLWRGAQYDRRAGELLAEQVRVYQQAFPDKDVPSSSIILRRMRSELQRLEGIGGTAQAQQGGDNPALYPPSALTHLHDVVNALPDGLRYQVSDLAIQPELIRIDGIAEDSVAAGAVSRAIDQSDEYQAEPANTRARGDFGVNFDFSVRPTKPRDQPEQPQAVGAGS